MRAQLMPGFNPYNDGHHLIYLKLLKLQTECSNASKIPAYMPQNQEMLQLAHGGVASTSDLAADTLHRSAKFPDAESRCFEKYQA